MNVLYDRCRVCKAFRIGENGRFGRCMRHSLNTHELTIRAHMTPQRIDMLFLLRNTFKLYGESMTGHDLKTRMQGNGLKEEAVQASVMWAIKAGFIVCTNTDEPLGLKSWTRMSEKGLEAYNVYIKKPDPRNFKMVFVGYGCKDIVIDDKKYEHLLALCRQFRAAGGDETTAFLEAAEMYDAEVRQAMKLPKKVTPAPARKPKKIGGEATDD